MWLVRDTFIQLVGQYMQQSSPGASVVCAYFLDGR